MGAMIQVRGGSDPQGRRHRTVFPTVRCPSGQRVASEQHRVHEGNEEILNAREPEPGRQRALPGRTPLARCQRLGRTKVRSSISAKARGRALMVWELEKMRSDILTSRQAIYGRRQRAGLVCRRVGRVKRNAWMVSTTADRVLFGNSKGNAAISGVMATALLTITAATGKMTAATVTLAKPHRPPPPRRRASGRSPSTTTKRMVRDVHCRPLPFRDLMRRTP